MNILTIEGFFSYNQITIVFNCFQERSGSIFRLLLAEIQEKKPNTHIVSNITIMVILEKTLCILPSQRPTARELLSVSTTNVHLVIHKFIASMKL